MQHLGLRPGRDVGDALAMLLEARLEEGPLGEEAAYRRVDPEGLARSLPGVAEVGGPVVVSAMGRPGRFARGEQFKSFTGLVPRASETGESDRKGQPMSKAGSSLLRHQPMSSANVARKLGPPAGRGLPHPDGRAGRPSHQGRGRGSRSPGQAGLGRHAPLEPYVVCDVNGRPVTAGGSQGDRPLPGKA